MSTTLSKEKKNQLVLVTLGTIGAIAGLWFCLISPQKDKITETANKIAGLRDQIDKVKQVVRESGQVETDLKLAAERLVQIESAMPSGDSYLWMNNTLKQFNRPGHKVEIPAIGIPVISEMNMLPGFPYHQATSTINGTAYYSDVGRFIAEFENQFPYMRIQNLNAEPGGGGVDEREKLTFRMEIVTLIKPNTL